MAWRINVSASAEKQLAKLDRAVAKRILAFLRERVEALTTASRLDDGDWKTVQKIARKRGWGRPGQAWTPGVDDLDA